MDFPQELVPTEPGPVPHTQPQSTRVKIAMKYLVLQRGNGMEWRPAGME